MGKTSAHKASASRRQWLQANTEGGQFIPHEMDDVCMYVYIYKMGDGHIIGFPIGNKSAGKMLLARQL